MAVAAAFLVLTGCEDQHEKEEIVPPAKAFVELSEYVIEAKSTGEGQPVAKSITITSSEDWKISGASLWIRLSAIKGKSGQEVTFTIDPNNTREVKTCTFEVSAGNSEPVLLEVKSIPPDYLNLLSKRNETLPADGGDVTVMFESNLEVSYEISPASDWIAMTGEDKGQFTFHAVANDGDARNVNIILKAEGVNPVTVSVAQQKYVDPNETSFFNSDDMALVEELQSMKWIAEERTADGYEVLEAGMVNSHLTLEYWETDDWDLIYEISGLGAFPSLTSITLDEVGDVWRVDLTDCGRITGFEAINCDIMCLEELHFGNNPISEVSLNNGWYFDRFMFPGVNLAITGSNIKVIDVGRIADRQDGMLGLDVSGCPALTELKAIRCARNDNGCYGALEEIVLSQKQYDAWQAGTLKIEMYEQGAGDTASSTAITVK